MDAGSFGSILKHLFHFSSPKLQLTGNRQTWFAVSQLIGWASDFASGDKIAFYCLSLRPAGLDYKLNLISDINPLLFLVIATFKPYLSYSPFTFITLVVILSCHTKIPVLCCYGVSITKEFNWQAGEAQCSDCEKKTKNKSYLLQLMKFYQLSLF